ncbi:unnamed protein product [Arabidopsis lyrata]|nr:unnamed protein product [Arabidopsis lyrata]
MQTTTIGPPQRQASRNTRLVTAEGQRSQDVVGSSKFQNCQKKVREKRTTKKKLMIGYKRGLKEDDNHKTNRKFIRIMCILIQRRNLLVQNRQMTLLDSHPELTTLCEITKAILNLNSPVMQQDEQICWGEEDDDGEVIVSKPLVAEKRKGAPDQMEASSCYYGGFE